MTKLKKRSLRKTTVVDFATYLGVTVLFVVMYSLQSSGSLTRSLSGLLIPICCYMSMAVSLNLTVGILGELSLGHAGFMSVGAFSGIIATMSLQEAVPSAPLRLAIAMVVGAFFAAIVGFLVGAPVLRLQGDYLAIVTLAFGEIIKELVNCLIVGVDENGLHMLFNLSGSKSAADLGLTETGTAIIKGAQGAVGVKTIASFPAGYILVMVTLFVVLNLVRSRQGRAIMAIRDNEIAAAASGINVSYYKMLTFTVSAFFAGITGALYACSNAALSTTSFAFTNGSILNSVFIVVMVVVGGMGSLTGSVIAAVVLFLLNYTIKNGAWVSALPAFLQNVFTYPMLVYSIALVIVIMFRPRGIMGSREFALCDIPRWLAKLRAWRMARSEGRSVQKEARHHV